MSGVRRGSCAVQAKGSSSSAGSHREQLRSCRDNKRKVRGGGQSLFMNTFLQTNLNVGAEPKYY